MDGWVAFFKRVGDQAASFEKEVVALDKKVSFQIVGKAIEEGMLR